MFGLTKAQIAKCKDIYKDEDGYWAILKGEYVLSEENQKAEEVEILSAVLKKYKGTEWVVLVKARIEEIKNGI